MAFRQNESRTIRTARPANIPTIMATVFPISSSWEESTQKAKVNEISPILTYSSTINVAQIDMTMD